MLSMLANQVGVALAKPNALCSEAAAEVLRDGAGVADDAHTGSGFVALRCGAPSTSADGEDTWQPMEWVAAHTTPSFAMGVLTHKHDKPDAVISRRGADGAPRVVSASV